MTDTQKLMASQLLMKNVAAKNEKLTCRKSTA